jgi:hypothetical protein
LSGTLLIGATASLAGMISLYAGTKEHLRATRYDKYIRLMEEGNLDQYNAALFAKEYCPTKSEKLY